MEQSAVFEFLREGFREHLAQAPEKASALTFLKDIANILDEADSWLDLWERSTSRHATRQLAAALRECWPEIARSGKAWTSGAASASGRIAERVGLWLRAAPQQRRLEQAFESVDDEWSDDLIAAIDAFQRLQPINA